MLELELNALLSMIDQNVILLIFPFALFFLIFGLDDLLIDLIAWFYQIYPSYFSKSEWNQISLLPEKKLAILIAAWKEEGVLRQMIQGNHSRIQYKNYSFFLGVYPNDPGTLREALDLQNEYKNVHVVINSIEGPTCKGQMLNQIVQEIERKEKQSQITYDGIIIHDSEDIIHPKELKLSNYYLSHYDFIQIPIFSLEVPYFSWVAGTYMDEFSEAHTKDMLVRSALGLPIPSSGVGTTLSSRLIKIYCKNQGGDLLNKKSLTEDYELGVSTASHGLKSKFACYYLESPNGEKEYIATRAYFPRSFKASVRQKTRWTLGIAFQGMENLGWKGSLGHKYFLFRDRKGPFCNFMTGIALLLFLYCFLRSWDNLDFLDELSWDGSLVPIFAANLMLMCNRITQRILSTHRVYGWSTTFLSPFRLPIGNLINGLAAIRAIYQYLKGKAFGVAPKWAKTDHELPLNFGTPVSSTNKINQESISG